MLSGPNWYFLATAANFFSLPHSHSPGHFRGASLRAAFSLKGPVSGRVVAQPKGFRLGHDTQTWPSRDHSSNTTPTTFRAGTPCASGIRVSVDSARRTP
eukprot:7175057-Pyramimonas_sp.AAC.1